MKERIIPAALILIFGFAGLFLFNEARTYGTKEPEIKGWCYGEFGHPRPRAFCEQKSIVPDEQEPLWKTG